MAETLLGVGQNDWSTILSNGGLLLSEDTAMKTLVEGLKEKELEGGVTLTTDPSSAYSIIFAKVDNDFCSMFDQAIIELAPAFLDNYDQPYEGSLSALAEAIGDNRVITCYADNNLPLSYQANITKAYITQRAAMLNLFVTPAFDIYDLPVVVQSADIILPTTDYIENPEGVWVSDDTTIATITNSGTLTVVSEGICDFDFTGTNSGITGTVTVHCFLMPSVNLVTAGSTVDVGLNYNTSATDYGVTVYHQSKNTGTGLGGWFVINGTMTQAATIPLAPMNDYVRRIAYTDENIEGDLLLWVEEQEGSCTIDRGRVYIEFCDVNISSKYTTNGIHEILLRSVDQPVQITKAKLIKNDRNTIAGIRIFAPEGTVFDNYKIKIGMKKFLKSNSTYNFGLLESFMQYFNEYKLLNTNAYCTRFVDGSFGIFIPSNRWMLNYSGNSFITSLTNPCKSSQYSSADIITSGQVIAASGKILRFSVNELSKDFMFANEGYVGFGLLYADGSKACEIPYFDGGLTGKTTTSFIAEQDINSLYCTVVKTSVSSGGDYRILTLRLSFNLEEVSLDDLDFEGIELFNDELMINQGNIYVKYEPAAIIGSPIASELIWTSSDENVATIDSTGHVTIHSDGNVMFTATSAKHPEITATTSIIECYTAFNDNIIENLIKADSPKSYSQSGLTCTLNTDGTVTINGKTTSTDTTYIRNVIWPLGSSKTAWDIHFLRQGISGVALVWFEYVSGSVEGVSSFSSGTIFSEIYIMNHGGTELSGIKVRRMVDLYSTASTHNFAMKSASGDTNGFRCIVFGFQFKKGTTFNNYRFKIGVKKITTLTYHASVFEQFMPAIATFYKLNPNNKTMWSRYPDGSIGGYLTESLTSLPTATGYIRISDAISYNSNLNNLLTGDKVGVIGHNYRFSVNLITLKYDRISTTEMKFGIAYADGTTAVEIPVVDSAEYTSDGTNVSLNGSSYVVDFLAEKQIDYIYQYYKNFKVKSNFEYFGVKMIDLDAYTIEAGERVYVSSSIDYNQTIINSGGSMIVGENGSISNIVVNDGGYLIVSGGTASDIKENGGRVELLTGSATYVPNEISSQTLNYATVHSGTTLTSCIVDYCEVLDQGRATDLTILKEGYVKTWGYASNVTLTSNSYFKVTYGSAYNVVVNSGTHLDVCGNVYGIVENGGFVWISDYSSPDQYHSFASNTLNNFEITDKLASIHSNTVMSNVVINTSSGGLYIFKSGIASDVTVSNGELRVYSGGTSYDTDVIPLPGNTELVSSTGAVVTYKSSYSGVFYASNYLLISSALTMENMNINRTEELVITSGGTTSNITVASSGFVKVSSGGTASSTLVKATGQLAVNNGGTVVDTIVSSGGEVAVNEGGILSGSVSAQSGAIVNLSGSVIYDVQDRLPSSEPLMLFESGAVVYNISDVEKKVIVDEGQPRGAYSLVSTFANSNFTSTFAADVYNTSNVFIGRIVGTSSFTCGRNEYSFTTSNSTLLFNKVLYIPATSTGYVVSSGEVLSVPTGEWYSSTTVESGGKVIISSGASMVDLVVDYGATVSIVDGQDAASNRNVVLNGGYLDVSRTGLYQVSYLPNNFSGYVYESGLAGTLISGTTATDVVVNPGGYLAIYDYGSAVVTENGGNVVLQDGHSYATFKPNTITGSLTYSKWEPTTVHSNTIISNCSVSNIPVNIYSSGIASQCTFTQVNCDIHSGGIVKDCVFSSGFIIAYEKTSVNNITLKYNANLIISSGGIATNVSKTRGTIDIYVSGVLSNFKCLESGHADRIIVHQGGKITGQIYMTDGNYQFNDYAIVDFDIANQYPHVVLIKGLDSNVSQNYPIYTITTKPTGCYGPFILAENFPNDYTGSIIVCDSVGTSLGEIYPNSSATIDGVDYDLELESGLLTLTRQGRMLYVSGSDVVLSSGDVYDYASVISGRVTMSSGASVGFMNLDYTGSMYISQGANVSKTRLNGGSAGAGNSTWIHPVPNTFSDINMVESKNMLVYSNTVASNININSGNSVLILGNGCLSGATAITSSFVNAWEYGSVYNLNASEGVVQIDGHALLSSAILTDTILRTNGGGTTILDVTETSCINIISLHSDTNIQILSNGEPIIASNGVMSNAIISGKINLYSSSVLQNVTVYSNGIYVDSNARAVDIVTSDADLYITGGTVSNATMNHYGSFTVFGGGGIIDTVHLNGSSGRIIGKVTGTVRNVTFEGKTDIVTTNGHGTISNATFISANDNIYQLQVRDGGVVINPIIDSGGMLAISSGGTGLNVAWTPGVGTLQVFDGAYVTYASSIEGVYYAASNVVLSSAATITSLNMKTKDHLFVMSGGIADTINIVSASGCHVSIFNGGSCNNLSSFRNGCEVTVLSGGILTNINGFAAITIRSGGYVSGLVRSGSGGEINVSAGGLLENVNLTNTFFYLNYTALGVASGGSLNSAIINSKALITIVSGGRATNLIENGGGIFTQIGAEVSFVPNTITLRDPLPGQHYVTIHSNTSITNSSLTLSHGAIYVYDGATISNVVVDSYGLVDIRGGSVNSLTINSGGSATFGEAGGIATHVIENGGRIWTTNATNIEFDPNTITLSTINTVVTVHSNTTVINEGIEIVSNGYLGLYDSVTLDGIIVSSGGSLSVEPGASALNVTSNSGAIVTVREGAYITYT